MDTQITKRGLTNQEVYTKVKAHLLKQGRRAVNPNAPASCKYRSSEGLMCAVGCLIPDDRYDPKMEGRLVRNLIPAFALEDLFGDVSTELLIGLQDLHDCADPETWPERLSAGAEQFNLEDI